MCKRHFRKGTSYKYDVLLWNHPLYIYDRVCTTSIWCISSTLDSPQSELPADHLSIHVIPLIIANGPPAPIVKDLNSSLKVLLPTNQPQRRSITWAGKAGIMTQSHKHINKCSDTQSALHAILSLCEIGLNNGSYQVDCRFSLIVP